MLKVFVHEDYLKHGRGIWNPNFNEVGVTMTMAEFNQAVKDGLVAAEIIEKRAFIIFEDKGNDNEEPKIH